MKSAAYLKRLALAAVSLGCIGATATSLRAATNNYFGTTGTISGNVWSTSVGGPYTSAFNTGGGGGIMNFGNTTTTVTGATLTVAGINATANVATWTAGGTISNVSNGVIPVTVASGITLDMGSQSFTNSATAGYSFTGPGTWAVAGNTYGGGFTLNSGTLIARGVNAMGGGATNTLTINGGTIAANASRDFTGKFGGAAGIVVNGNFTVGDTTGLANSTATLTFSNNVNLTGGSRTITIGGNASGVGYTFSGKVSNGGLTIDAASGATGRVLLTSLTSDYSGGTTIKTGATLSTTGASSNVGFTAGPLGIGTLTIDGGQYIASSSGTNTIANNITLNNVPLDDNDISVGGTSTLSGNITGAGGFRKGSSGILILSGANNYAGQTVVSSGTLALAKTQSFYNGVPASWTDTNFSVDSGATLVYAVGGGGEFSLAQFLQQATVGTGSGGFKDGSNIGIDTTNGGDQTISTVFTDNNSGANKLGLVKSGTNTLFLTAANTHSGPTIPAGGTLNLSNQLALQNSTLTTSSGGGATVFDQSVGGNAFTLGGLAGNGNLSLLNNAGSPAPIALTVGNNNTDAAYSGNLSGAGASLIKVGTGIQALSGTNSYTGGTTVNAGTLAINSNSAIGAGPLTINTGAKLDNNGASATVTVGSISQSWNGNFSYTGTKALILGSSGTVAMAGNIEITATGTDAAANRLEVGGVISGAGFSLTKSGTGRIQLTGQNTFSGGVKVILGTVHVGEQSSNLGSGTGPLGTGTLELAGGRLIGSSTGTTVSTIENNITLTGPANVATNANVVTANGTFTLSGLISGTGGLGKGGSGTVILKNANSFSGDTIMDSNTGGTLNLSNQLALQNSTLVTSSLGGSIAFDASVGSNAFTLGGLTGDRNLVLQNNAGSPAAIALSVGNNNSDTTYTGVMSGPGSLAKIGSGALTLTGSNLYAGNTTVSGGTLLANNTIGSATGTGSVTVASGATLGGSGSVAGAVTVQSGGTLSPGSSIESLGAGSVTFSSGSTFKYEVNSIANTADLLNAMGGSLSIASGVTLLPIDLNPNPNAISGPTYKYTMIAYDNGGNASYNPGAFSGLGELSIVTFTPGGKQFRIRYKDTAPGGNFSGELAGGVASTRYVTLTAVPELGSFITMGLAGCCAIGAIRLGKRFGFASFQI